MKSGKYKSKFEATQAGILTKAKVRFKYEPYSLEYLTRPHGAWCTVCASKDCVVVKRRYKPDWVSEDDILIVESKGKFTSSDRTKMLAVIVAYPEKDIRILFMRDNWLTRKKLEKYSDWAKKHNITYAVGDMPKEWVQDFKKHQIKGIAESTRKSAGEISTKEKFNEPKKGKKNSSRVKGIGSRSKKHGVRSRPKVAGIGG